MAYKSRVKHQKVTCCRCGRRVDEYLAMPVWFETSDFIGNYFYRHPYVKPGCTDCFRWFEVKKGKGSGVPIEKDVVVVT